MTASCNGSKHSHIMMLMDPMNKLPPSTVRNVQTCRHKLSFYQCYTYLILIWHKTANHHLSMRGTLSSCGAIDWVW